MKKVFIIIIIVFLIGGGLTTFFVLSNMKEAAVLKEAETLNTIEAYESYLEKYPHKKDDKEIAEKVESLTYDRIMYENTIESYNEFLEKYPENEHKEEIVENVDWLETEKSRDVAVYKGFIEKYPESRFLSRAKLRIQQYDFWAKTKPIRDKFLTLLSSNKDLSVEFYPHYVKYAADVLAHNLPYEAAAIITVLQYHNNIGILESNRKALDILTDAMKNISSYRVNDMLNQSEIYSNKQKVFQAINYKEVLKKIDDLVQNGDIEVDMKSVLLEQEQEEVDQEKKLAEMLKYIRVTQYLIIHEDFVNQCADFIGKNIKNGYGVIDLLSYLHTPIATEYLVNNSGRYAPTPYFNSLAVVTSRYKEEMFTLLDSVEGSAQANIIYGFGVSGDKKAKEKIYTILEQTEDVSIKVACYYALTRMGEDRSNDLNTLFKTSLKSTLQDNADEKTTENKTTDDEAKDIKEAAVSIVGQILSAFQWMRNPDLEKKIDQDLLKQSVKLNDFISNFFTLAIWADLQIGMNDDILKLALVSLESENENLKDVAKLFFTGYQETILELLTDSNSTLSSSQKRSLMEKLKKETFDANKEIILTLINQYLKSGDSDLVGAGISAIGNCSIGEHQKDLIDYLNNSDYSFSSAINYVLLNQADPDKGIKSISSKDGNAALIARAFLGDKKAVKIMNTRLNESYIQDLLQILNISSILNETIFYKSYYKNMTYTNSYYAPTDYFVAYAAQTAALSLLVNNKSLRDQLSEK